MSHPDAQELSTGQRIKLHRERAGKSRAVLAGLVGKSPEWVKAVETGRLLPPRLPMLVKIAKALRVPVSALADHVDDVREQISGPQHPLLPTVRDALNRYPLQTDTPPQPLNHIRARIATAWQARHAAPDHRTVIGGLLPDLITDTQLAARTYSGQARHQANALLAETLGLAQMFLAYQPATDLLWRVADRAMLAAQESGDPRSIAGAAWFLAEVHRDAGDWDAAMTVNLDGLRVVEPALPDGDDELLGMFGALHAAAAFTAARSGEDGRAWRHWDIADRAVHRLPDDYVQKWTSFSRPVMTAHAVTLAVELQKGGEALRQARRMPATAIVSRPRRARHLIEVARGHHLRRQPDETIAVLREAYTTAPETIRWNTYARQMTLGLLQGPPSLRRDAHVLAVKVGVLAA